MTTANAARLEFAPPATPGLFRAMLLAIFVHGLLLAVLALGVQWKRDAPPVTVEAELWSAVPVQAAPPPQPEPIPVPPEPVVAPVAKEVIEPPPAPIPPIVDPSIAIEKEKARLEHQKQLQLEQQERLEQQSKQREALKAQQIKEQKEAREKEQREKLAREKKLQQQLQEQQKLQATRNDVDAKKLADLRKQQLERMTRMADQATGNGQAGSTGSAKQSSGPSSSYAGRIVARIKPNITYTESINGNPVADVEVRTSPDGTIISRRLVKSSGVKSWDDAVINAIDKTEKLPPDIDGRVIPSLTLGFRPKD